MYRGVGPLVFWLSCTHAYNISKFTPHQANLSALIDISAYLTLVTSSSWKWDKAKYDAWMASLWAFWATITYGAETWNLALKLRSILDPMMNITWKDKQRLMDSSANWGLSGQRHTWNRQNFEMEMGRSSRPYSRPQTNHMDPTGPTTREK